MMKNKRVTVDDCVGCFGDFNVSDTMCRKLCAVSLRCCLERDEKLRIDILEDLMHSAGATLRMQ